MTVQKVGIKAPAFSLLNQMGVEVNSKSLLGKKIVLYFYPKAMTPGCTTQACGLRDVKKDLLKFNAIALGVSPDDPKKLLKFIEKESLNFDLLSDPEHKLIESYGIWSLKKFMGKEYMGVVRTTFIIDEEGKLIHILDDFKTKSHHENVLEFLKKYKV
jgi:peroxiredoxin Q/BCP